MGALRQARSFNLDGSSSNQGVGTYTPSMNQSLPTLIVMIVVLFIIMAFCFWGAPAVRAFCRRRVCCCCPMDEPNIDNEFSESQSTTPTIILLPYGRMLVVDRAVFAQLRATHTGIDFMELSSNLIRAQRVHTGSNNSNRHILPRDKMFLSNKFLPPAYEELYDKNSCDLPPSYSQISVVSEKSNCNNLNRHVSLAAPLFFNTSVNRAILRTFPSVPSIPNEVGSNRRQLLITTKKRYSSLDTIYTNFTRQNISSNGTSNQNMSVPKP